MAVNDQSWSVAALYKFFAWPDHASWQTPIREACERHGICGTLLLAREGINGTIAGAPDALPAFLAFLRDLPGLSEIEVKHSTASEQPFYRMKVRLKKEIVTMGVPDIDPNRSVGTYVAPKDWNALISDPDTIVIDTRNDYETAIGMFEGAVDPETESFRDFPAWAEAFKARQHNAPARRIAMYCTGGIRCEKSTALMKEMGFEEVYHLQGGILKYLEDVPEAESLWKGQCFVFDQRVSVGHGLAEGGLAQCFACRRPLQPDDLLRPEYERGVACHQCVDDFSDADRNRFRERQRQIDLAKARGEAHIGKSFSE